MQPAPHPSVILIVDDDEGLLLLMADALRAAGHTVAAADSAAGAIASVRSRAPDLMVLDLQLKDAGGVGLLERLKAEGVGAPFVVVTGQGDEKVAVEMMKRGALDYVMKDIAILDLLPEVVRRALAAIDRERTLANAAAERRRLEAQVLEISENERRQFGADLHDGIGQQLTAIELMCVGLKDDVSALDPKLGAQLRKIAELLRSTIAQTRAMARGLALVGDEPDALRSGLAGLAAQFDADGRLRCRLQAPPLRAQIDRQVAVHLFRIAQEAVNNAAKHSGATEIVIRLEERAAALRLEIDDNGEGLPAGVARGLGLRLMEYRAAVIGATLALDSRPGIGLTVRCLLPIKGKHELIRPP